MSSSSLVFVAASERHRTIANKVKRNATSLCDSDEEEEDEEVREGGRAGILLIICALNFEVSQREKSVKFSLHFIRYESETHTRYA